MQFQVIASSWYVAVGLKILLVMALSSFFTPETRFQSLHYKKSDSSCLLTTVVFKLFLEFACFSPLLGPLAFQFHLKLENNEKKTTKLETHHLCLKNSCFSPAAWDISEWFCKDSWCVSYYIYTSFLVNSEKPTKTGKKAVKNNFHEKGDNPYQIASQSRFFQIKTGTDKVKWKVSKCF